MAKWLGVFALVVLFGALATPAMAQTGGEGEETTEAAADDYPLGRGLAYFGAGLVVLGIVRYCHRVRVFVLPLCAYQ